MRLYLILFAVLLGISCTFTSEKTVTFGVNGNDSEAQPLTERQLTERFAASFADGRSIETPEHTGVLSLRGVGTLKITSGLLVACDPLVNPKGAAFSSAISPGEYPVFLSLFTTDTDERVAFAKLVVGSSPAVTWKIAKLRDDPAGDRSFYFVDSGTGSFMDLQTAMVVSDKLGAEILHRDSSFSDVVIRAMDENRRAGKGDWADIFVP